MNKLGETIYLAYIKGDSEASALLSSVRDTNIALQLVCSSPSASCVPPEDVASFSSACQIFGLSSLVQAVNEEWQCWGEEDRHRLQTAMLDLVLDPKFAAVAPKFVLAKHAHLLARITIRAWPWPALFPTLACAVAPATVLLVFQEICASVVVDPGLGGGSRAALQRGLEETGSKIVELVSNAMTALYASDRKEEAITMGLETFREIAAVVSPEVLLPVARSLFLTAGTAGLYVQFVDGILLQLLKKHQKRVMLTSLPQDSLDDFLSLVARVAESHLPGLMDFPVILNGNQLESALAELEAVVSERAQSFVDIPCILADTLKNMFEKVGSALNYDKPYIRQLWRSILRLALHPATHVAAAGVGAMAAFLKPCANKLPDWVDVKQLTCALILRLVYVGDPTLFPFFRLRPSLVYDADALAKSLLSVATGQPCDRVSWLLLTGVTWQDLGSDMPHPQRISLLRQQVKLVVATLASHHTATLSACWGSLANAFLPSLLPGPSSAESLLFLNASLRSLPPSTSLPPYPSAPQLLLPWFIFFEAFLLFSGQLLENLPDPESARAVTTDSELDAGSTVDCLVTPSGPSWLENCAALLRRILEYNCVVSYDASLYESFDVFPPPECTYSYLLVCRKIEFIPSTIRLLMWDHYVLTLQCETRPEDQHQLSFQESASLLALPVLEFLYSFIKPSPPDKNTYLTESGKAIGKRKETFSSAPATSRPIFTPASVVPVVDRVSECTRHSLDALALLSTSAATRGCMLFQPFMDHMLAQLHHTLQVSRSCTPHFEKCLVSFASSTLHLQTHVRTLMPLLQTPTFRFLRAVRGLLVGAQVFPPLPGESILNDNVAWEICWTQNEGGYYVEVGEGWREAIAFLLGVGQDVDNACLLSRTQTMLRTLQSLDDIIVATKVPPAGTDLARKGGYQQTVKIQVDGYGAVVERFVQKHPLATWLGNIFDVIWAVQLCVEKLLQQQENEYVRDCVAPSYMEWRFTEGSISDASLHSPISLPTLVWSSSAMPAAPSPTSSSCFPEASYPLVSFLENVVFPPASSSFCVRVRVFVFSLRVELLRLLGLCAAVHGLFFGSVCSPKKWVEGCATQVSNCLVRSLDNDVPLGQVICHLKHFWTPVLAEWHRLPYHGHAKIPWLAKAVMGYLQGCRRRLDREFESLHNRREKLVMEIQHQQTPNKATEVAHLLYVHDVRTAFFCALSLLDKVVAPLINYSPSVQPRAVLRTSNGSTHLASASVENRVMDLSEVKKTPGGTRNESTEDGEALSDIKLNSDLYLTKYVLYRSSTNLVHEILDLLLHSLCNWPSQEVSQSAITSLKTYVRLSTETFIYTSTNPVVVTGETLSNDQNCIKNLLYIMRGVLEYAIVRWRNVRDLMELYETNNTVASLQRCNESATDDRRRFHKFLNSEGEGGHLVDTCVFKIIKAVYRYYSREYKACGATLNKNNLNEPSMVFFQTLLRLPVPASQSELEDIVDALEAGSDRARKIVANIVKRNLSTTL